MTYANLDIKNQNDILILTINREKALNALNGKTMEELKHFFSVPVSERKKIKGIVITGAGNRAFVAGADIKEFLGLDGAKAQAMSANGHQIFFLIERYPIPVIAAVNGFALGGGCELAMACHLRVAGAKAKFGQPEVNLGLVPGFGGTQRLPKLVGRGRALELLMTGDMIDAQEAYRIGLVNHVVDAGEEINKACTIIEKIATKAPVAVANVIAAVDAACKGQGETYALEAKAFGKCASTADFREGASAFIERRKANFKGE